MVDRAKPMRAGAATSGLDADAVTFVVRSPSGGLALIMVAAALWGTVGVATKGIYELSETNPLSIGFLRLVLAAPALLLASRVTAGARLKVPRRDLGLMLLIGLAMALYQVCYFAAIERLGVMVAVLVAICTSPVIVALAAVLLLGERLTGTVALALASALTGTALIASGPGDGGTTLDPIGGLALAFAAAFGYASVVLCSRALAGRYHPLQPITVGFGAGALILLPFTLATGLVLEYPPAAWALLLHLALVPTVLAYIMFLIGIRVTTAATASIATLIEPMTSAILAWVLFGEHLGPTGLVGAGLLLGALILLYRGQRGR